MAEGTARGRRWRGVVRTWRGVAAGVAVGAGVWRGGVRGAVALYQQQQDPRLLLPLHLAPRGLLQEQRLPTPAPHIGRFFGLMLSGNYQRPFYLLKEGFVSLL